jgi:hypothetical protein
MNVNLPDILVAIATFLLVISCVVVHYEGLRLLSRWGTDAVLLRPRARVAWLVCGQLILHTIEIAIFGLGYFWLTQGPEYGSFMQANPLIGYADIEMSFMDMQYFSAVVYSTLGFGDIIPKGPIRYTTGIESVTGLVLITWSASFTFLEMQRYWERDE